MNQYQIKLSNDDLIIVNAENINELVEEITKSKSLNGYIITSKGTAINTNQIVTIRELEDWEKME